MADCVLNNLIWNSQKVYSVTNIVNGFNKFFGKIWES